MIRSINRLMCVSLFSLLFIANAGQKAMAQDVAVSYQTFYDNLSPYGQWVNDPQYGNVFVPNEGGDFRPYGTRGHWVMTDYGNTWVSDDPWGWACYHYGRWTYDPYYGWVWIPGYEWAPAWVSWRYGGGYCGWAPLGPGMSVSAGYGCPDSWWVFVAPGYMYQRDCLHYWRGPSYNGTYIHQTAVINNYYVDNGTHVRYNYGPKADVIERDTHQPVQVYRVSQGNRAGAAEMSGNRITMYRPPVNRSTAAEARPANVIQAPRAISSRPQPATNVSATRQPQFHQDLPKIAAQPQRGAPQQQPQRGAPQQQPQRQAPQQQPQRQAPQQQPQRQAPQQQPQRQAPQQQPQRQAPQPQRQAPQPQRQAPQPQPQRQAPQPQRQAPQPQRQAPQPQRQAPPPQRQAPPPQRQAPQQHEAPPREEGGRR